MFVALRFLLADYLHGRFDMTTVPSGRFLARYDDIYLHPYQLAKLVALMYTSRPYTIYPIFQMPVCPC